MKKMSKRTLMKQREYGEQQHQHQPHTPYEHCACPRTANHVYAMDVTHATRPCAADMHMLRLPPSVGMGTDALGRPKMTTALDKVRREIVLMSSCAHANIIPLHAIIDDEEEDPLMLILEYADKGQIMEWDGEWRWTEAATLQNPDMRAHCAAECGSSHVHLPRYAV